MVKDCETRSYEERLEAQGTLVWTKELTAGDLLFVLNDLECSPVKQGLDIYMTTMGRNRTNQLKKKSTLPHFIFK